MKKYILVSLLLLAGFSLSAESADDVVGFWFNQEKDAKFEIFKCGSKYCGKIFWLKAPTYTASDDQVKDHRKNVGDPKVDTENPTEANRTKPIVGSQFLSGFDYDGGNKWSNGSIYNARDGKTYKSTMTLKSADVIDVRGYVGWGALSVGKNQTWTRTAK
jgi:uncharacterized protein (DUF2147 family)